MDCVCWRLAHQVHSTVGGVIQLCTLDWYSLLAVFCVCYAPPLPLLCPHRPCAAGAATRRARAIGCADQPPGSPEGEQAAVEQGVQAGAVAQQRCDAAVAAGIRYVAAISDPAPSAGIDALTAGTARAAAAAGRMPLCEPWHDSLRMGQSWMLCACGSGVNTGCALQWSWQASLQSVCSNRRQGLAQHCILSSGSCQSRGPAGKRAGAELAAQADALSCQQAAAAGTAEVSAQSKCCVPAVAVCARWLESCMRRYGSICKV